MKKKIMKSYTTIEQSLRLAEILPLESADMVLLHEEPYETSDSKFDGLHQALCVPFSKYRGWWESKGCNVEKYTAETYGKQIWEIDQFDEIKLFGI